MGEGCWEDLQARGEAGPQPQRSESRIHSGKESILWEVQYGDVLYILLVVFTSVRKFKCPSILSIILISNYCLKQLNIQNTPEEVQRKDETATLSGTLLNRQNNKKLNNRFYHIIKEGSPD